MTWNLVARADGADAAIKELEHAIDACQELEVHQAAAIRWAAAELVRSLNPKLVCQISTVGHIETDGLSSFASVTVHSRTRPLSEDEEAAHG